MRVRNLSSGSLCLELQGCGTAADHHRSVTSYNIEKNKTLKKWWFLFTWSLWGLLLHKGQNYCNGQSSDSLFYLLLYRHFIVGDFFFILIGKNPSLYHGSVQLLLAKHGLKKVPALIAFIWSSRQALHQYLTPSLRGQAAGCLASRRGQERGGPWTQLYTNRGFGLATASVQKVRGRRVQPSRPALSCLSCSLKDRLKLRQK